MGLSTKQVSGDHQGFDQPELPKPPSSARRPQTEPLNCPRCSSTNTKFCYYNNYNKSQPRHFCKSCKRHWTRGGTLRNVPVGGGGGRKNKRPMTSAAAAAATAKDLPNFPMKSIPNIPLLHDKSDNNNNNGPNTSDFDQWSSLSTNYLEMNNPISYQSLNAFDHHYPGTLDSIEELNNILGFSSVPWPGPDTDSTLDMPNYWNWSEMDVLASSSGHLNVISLDDTEIKP